MDVTTIDIDTARKVLSVVDRGLCCGLGEPIPGKMCVEAAVCYALGLPHDDDPKCVDPALRLFVITLNDSSWSSPTARAVGMRKLAVAQLGSLGKLESIKFVQRLAEQTIRLLLPPMLRQIGLSDVADRCALEGTEEVAHAAGHAAAARYAAHAADAAHAAKTAAKRAAEHADALRDADVVAAARCAADARYSARCAADALRAADAAAAARYAASYAAAAASYAGVARCAAAARYAAHAASYAAGAAARAADAADADRARDSVLILMSNICIDILRDMGAPGIDLMDQVC